MNQIIKALEFARDAHNGQTRRYTGEPYIVHPIAVAILVSTVLEDDEAVVAALLHDVVEDCGVGLDTLDKLFGHRVGTLVWSVTRKSTLKDGPRAVRKAIDRKHYSDQDEVAQTIKAADIIDNVKGILKHDPEFADVYVPEQALLLRMLTKANPTLVEQARNLIGQYSSYLLKGTNELGTTK